MELLTAIETRSSAARLSLPAPTREDLAVLLAAAERAPDHGRLKPWRLMVLESPLRERFAEAAAAAKRVKLPDMTQEQFEAEKVKVLRAPTLIIVACTVRREQSRIPEIEQVMAVAAATQNLFLAAHALGYGVMWKTGAAAYDTGVKATLELRADDHIVGIMHVGTREK